MSESGRTIYSYSPASGIRYQRLTGNRDRPSRLRNSEEGGAGAPDDRGQIMKLERVVIAEVDAADTGGNVRMLFLNEAIRSSKQV